MFTLYTLEESIQVPPYLFGKPRLSALEHMLNRRFSDKLIPDIGLCIAVWDIIKTSEDRLVLQSGEASTKVVFRIVVFRPFVGEVMFSRINASTDAGLFLDVGFFDAVHVPQKQLPKPVSWDDNEKVWIWRPEGGAELFMDVSNECVCRVSEVRVDNSGMWVVGAVYDDVVADNQGLGDPLWWYEEEQAEEDVEGEAEGEAEGEEEGEAEEEAEGEAEGEAEEEQTTDGQYEEQDQKAEAEVEAEAEAEADVNTGAKEQGVEGGDTGDDQTAPNMPDLLAEEAEGYEEEEYPDEDYQPGE